jgi:hypothetical protein
VTQALIGLHVWAITESLDVLGVFGILSTGFILISADIYIILKGGFTAISSSKIFQPILNTREYIGERYLCAAIHRAR